MPFLTLYLTSQRSFSIGEATWATGVYGLGSLVGALTGGHLADRIGRRTVMLTSLLGSASILVLFPYLAARWAIFFALAAYAMLADMYRPAASAMIADLVVPVHRPSAFGLLYVAVNLGFSIGATVGGVLAKHWFLLLFWADAGTSMIYAAIILGAIRETLPGRSGTPHPVHALSAEDAHPQPPSTVSLAAAAAHILRDRAFMIFCTACLCIGLTYMQSISTFPIYLGGLGFEADRYGQIIALNGVMIVVLQLPLTALLNRFNRASVVVWSAVLTGVGFGLIGWAASLLQFAATVVVWTAGEMMAAAFMSAIVSDLAPVHLRARYMGVFTMCHSSAMMLGAPLGGAVLDRLGGAYLWGGSLAIGLLAALLFLSIHRQMAPRGIREASPAPRPHGRSAAEQ